MIDDCPSHEPVAELRVLIGELDKRFPKSFIKRARAYFSLVSEKLANSGEHEFPLLRKWLRHTRDLLTTDQQAERLYDDALRQLQEAENAERHGFAANDDD